ncbi:MAG: hypothetical protein NWE93_00480 [Candidatus Bathyarchaeota archaeon]|nr:hypothetical protein [Candidatus Bathyarchaeota archaeon]
MAENIRGAELTEQNVVAKVAELMETLDQVKQYNALTSALKKFALIVVSSIIVFLAVGASIGFLNLVATLDKPQLFLTALLLLLIPIGGISLGVVFIRKKVNSIKTGEWKGELSSGFPAALKILTELDWDKTFDEISIGRVGYAIYSFLKLMAYWIISFFAIALVGNGVAFIFLHETGVLGGPVLALISLLVVYLLLRKDFSRRYHQIRTLDNLLWELRWFSVELRRAEF